MPRLDNHKIHYINNIICQNTFMTVKKKNDKYWESSLLAYS